MGASQSGLLLVHAASHVAVGRAREVAPVRIQPQHTEVCSVWESPKSQHRVTLKHVPVNKMFVCLFVCLFFCLFVCCFFDKISYISLFAIEKLIISFI